jgi:predicted small lipoprotein YifL
MPSRSGPSGAALHLPVGNRREQNPQPGVLRGMKTLTLPLTVLTVLSLAACGERNGPPPPQAATDEIAGTGAVNAHRGEPGPPAEDADDLLDRVGMDADDTYEPELTGAAGGSMRLDGPLAPGEWRDLGARGLGYARTGFEPVAMFRCAADETGLIVTIPEPDSADGDATDETAPAGAAGSFITAGGTATGRFEPVEGDPSRWEMRVPSNHPALTGLAEAGRIGISLDSEETRRLGLSEAAAELISGCAMPAQR